MNDSFRRIAIAAYAVAAIFILLPILDVVASAYLDYDPGNGTWRYEVAGYVANYMISLVFGVLMAALAAALREDRLLLRLTSWFSGLVALGMILMMGLLALDIVQLQSVVTAQAHAAFLVGGLKAELKLGLMALGLLFLLVAGLKGSKGRAERDEPAMLVR